MKRHEVTLADPPPDRAAVISGLREVQQRRRQAEIDELCLVAQAADVYSWVDETASCDAAGVLHGERLWQFGADGTPKVAEFVTLEVGPALGLSPEAAAMLPQRRRPLHHSSPNPFHAAGCSRRCPEVVGGDESAADCRLSRVRNGARAPR